MLAQKISYKRTLNTASYKTHKNITHVQDSESAAFTWAKNLLPALRQ